MTLDLKPLADEYHWMNRTHFSTETTPHALLNDRNGLELNIEIQPGKKEQHDSH